MTDSLQPQAPTKAAYSTMALWCLGLGMGGLVCPLFGIASFVAVALGFWELQNIKNGLSAPHNRSLTLIGLICGFLGSLIVLVGLTYLCFEAVREVVQFLDEASRSKWF